MLQFDILIGGNGEGAIASGGYGYRIFDILAALMVGLLAIHALAPRRLLSLIIFTAGIAVLSTIRVLEPTFAGDARTVILAVHYVEYLFAGLYVAILLRDDVGRQAYCWGLVLGLLATVPIFIMQDNGYDSSLVALGLLPGYFQVLTLDVGDTLRFAGLWGHPNEAAHVAALAAPGAAYLFLVYRRALPLALTAGALLVVFYYTQSRGGLLVGGCVLAIPFFLGRRGQLNILRIVVAGAALAVCIVLISNLSFFSSRFDDAGTAGNFAERMDTVLSGLHIALTNPFGLSELALYSAMATGTGGVISPHNGFIFFAAVFGWLPFAVLIAAMGRSFFIRSDADRLFALMSVGLCLGFLFEELPESYPCAFVMCLIVGRAYLTTGIGRELIAVASDLGRAGKVAAKLDLRSNSSPGIVGSVRH